MAVAATFHEVQFPLSLGFGASGGPVRRAEIVTLASGKEERNSPWAGARRRWDAGAGVKSLDDLSVLLAFFEARRGPLHGFRFCDPLDHQSCAPSATPSAVDQPLGAGDGAATVFALIKRYGDVAGSVDRTIVKPVASTVRIAADGVELTSGADYSVNSATGQVTFTVPPAPGAVLTAGFAFDTPVRFDTDALTISLDAFAAGEVASAPVIEILL